MVKQSQIDIFKNEIYSRPPKKNCSTNKTIVKHIDDTWSMDLLDMVDYGVKNNKGYRYILVDIDNFSYLDGQFSIEKNIRSNVN